MTELLLRNARVVLENEIKHGGVLVRDGRIALVFADEQTPTGLSAEDSADLKGAYLAPGLIDIHIHGSAGVDTQSADQAGLRRLSEFLLAEGVTSYFATFVPTDERSYSAAIAEINSYIKHQDDDKRGARILGIHFEGPFVSEHRCGALKREHFRDYDGDPRSIEIFAGASNQSSCARLMTLAPETRGGIDLARELTARGVRAFIGHSVAEPETLDRAVEAGARHITHFPNALNPLHHRKPGAVAWGLVRGDVTIDLIADFHHVAPLMIRLIYQSKGAERIALISDAIQPTGMGDGEFSVWGVNIAVRDGLTALTAGPSAGTIAGSVITMRDALKNIASLGVPVHEAILMASLAPARAAGAGGERGSIKEGKRADLVAFDEDFAVQLAIVGGTVALRKM
jgi:N-acetylglucosamine-6-phosphate deacetylase